MVIGGASVRVFVEVGLYRGETWIDVDSGYWNLSTGWEGRLGTFVRADDYPDLDDMDCRLREARVTERG